MHFGYLTLISDPKGTKREPNKSKTLKSDVPRVPKQAEGKTDGVINLQNYNFNKLKQGHFYALKTL